MTINEYRKKLNKLNDNQFGKFKEDFGGDFKTREDYIRNFVDNPQHERRICQLLKLKTEEEKKARATIYSASSALISAIAAIIAVLFSYYVWSQNESTRKPIIMITDSKCTGNFNSENKELKIKLKVTLKNIGKHPAKNVRMRTWNALLDKPEEFNKSRDEKMANVFYPECIFTWTPTLTLKFNADKENFKIKKNKMFLYVKLDYTDSFYETQKYTNDIYLVYEIGSGSIGSATVETKKMFQKYLDEIK